MTPDTKITIDHTEIRNFIEGHKGTPVRTTTTKELQVRFPGRDDTSLENIPWEEFFTTFEDNNLAFMYQEKTAEGRESIFCKFVPRDIGAPTEETGATA